MFCICEVLSGRFAAFLGQKVGEKRIFHGIEQEENLWPPYAAHIELAVMISFTLLLASKR